MKIKSGQFIKGKNMKIKKGQFISEWDDGSVISTNCELYIATGELFPEYIDPPNHLENLQKEYFLTSDGEKLSVCDTCHEYVLKTVIGDREDLSYGEYTCCSNPECDSNL